MDAPVIPNHLAMPPNLQRLLIVRLGSMGDIVHTLPAAFALRQAFPEARLGWVVEERWAELLCTISEPRSGPCSPRRPLVDRVHVVDTKLWRSALASPQTWERAAAALSELRAPRYQIAVDFQGAIRSAVLARISRSPVIYGFAQPWENVASMLYSRQVDARGGHIVEQNLSLAEAVAHRPLAMAKVEFPRDETAEKYTEAWLRREGVGEFVLMNPGAGWGAKQWPPERYAEVAQSLAQRGLQSVANFGPGEEALATAAKAASGGTIRVIGCSLSQLIALTRRARLFIGGDTGPLHVAAALAVPVVAIFGPTNPRRNGPFGTRNIVLRSPVSVTSHARRVAPDEGMLEITVDQVLAAAQQLAEESRG